MGEVEMDEGVAAEAEGDDAEAEGGGLLALEATGLLTQDAEPGDTILVNACNGFNYMSRLAMLWTVRQRCMAGTRFALNFYRHWVQLLLLQPGEALVIILSREGVTQNDPLLMVLFRITLVPLAEYLRDMDPTLLSPLYANDVAFDGSARRRAVQLRLLMEGDTDQS